MPPGSCFCSSDPGGDAPSPIDPPTGCAFHPRCPRIIKGKCDKETPPLDAIENAKASEGGRHKVACFNPLT